MSSTPISPAAAGSRGNGIPRVLVATTALLSFISFWRAAAIVLNDLGSSAFYAGAIAEAAVGKAAPWFILPIMLFSYAVRSMYIESCSMFVRGGVSLMVREAMGVTLATFIVSALTFSEQALGWLRHSRLPYTVGLIGIVIGLGHSVLAMSGEETLAQVYREVEHPKLPNLEKAGLIIFVYSLVFTAGVSFFAFMIIPDAVRPQYFGNLISGLAMNFVGPYSLRLGFSAFVVVVGVLMLAGAVNTAIVGSNGVVNRVSEDGILPQWFRQPHRRFGTSYRMLNLVVGLPLLTIILSRGNIIVLGEAYAFGVMWSFAMKGLAGLVLRYNQPAKREVRVP